jgi:hypothetical protein
MSNKVHLNAFYYSTLKTSFRVPLGRNEFETEQRRMLQEMWTEVFG